MSDKHIHVVICGGGNGAHVLAGIVSNGNNNRVTVLDVYEDEPERWNTEMRQSGFRVSFPDQVEIFQKPDNIMFTVTRDVKVTEKADIVIFCLPAYGHQSYFEKVTAYLRDDCIVVGMPGQPGFEFQCAHYLRMYHKGCVAVSIETLPWAARISKYGSEVIVMGTKDTVMSSVMLRGNDKINKSDVVTKIQFLLGGKPTIKLTSHVLELTMHTKASLHPPIMYSKWRNWDGQPLDTPPLFYQGIDEEAAKYMNAVSDESLSIAREIARRCPDVDISQIGTLHAWLISHYPTQIKDKSSLLTSMKTNGAYEGLVHPMKPSTDGKFVPNFDYRYTREDIPYGLVVFRGIATMINVPTPVIDEIIYWAQNKLGKDFLVDGKLTGKDVDGTRIPQNFGFKTFDDLLNMS